MRQDCTVVVEREGYRLVHQHRDPIAWPNVSDLVLERSDADAMGESHWVHVYDWCLSAQSRYDLHQHPERSMAAIVALKLLLDPGPAVEK
jgi:hypothetical protein